MIQWSNSHKEFLKLSILISAFYMSMVSFPYTALYLKNIGIPTSLVGVVISAGAILSVVAQPFWGRLSDRILDAKRTMLIAVCLTAVTTLIMLLMKQVVMVIVMFLLRAIVLAPLMVLFEHYVVTRCDKSNGTMHYGAVRIWGSISFAAIALVFGWLMELFSLQLVFYFQSGMLFVLLWLVGRIVTGDPVLTPENKKEKASKVTRAIFTPSFVVFLIFVFMVILPDSTVNCFYPIIFQDAGGTLDLMGVSSSLRAIAEVPFFLSTAWLLRKYGSRKLMLMGAVLVLLRLICIGYLTTPIQLLVANAFGAPAYCLLMAGMLHYVLETVPQEHRTTAQMVASSFGWTMTQVVGSSVGGFMLEYFGIKSISAAGLLLVTAGAVIFIGNAIRFRRSAEKRNTASSACD